MLVATSTPKLNYEKAQRINELLRAFANKDITQKVLEERLKKLNCSELLKFYKE
jgi:DNA-binding HxlR family transcriptional regulator